MAVTTEITLPKLGESIVSATIVQWLKKEGDFVRLDEPLVEVATDKVNSEIPSPVEGILVSCIANVGEELSVGAAIATMQGEGEAPQLPASVPEKKTSPTTEPVEKNTFLSPAVLRLMREHGISHSQIEKIDGTGSFGRVTKKDIEAFVSKRAAKPAQEGVVQLSPMRAAIASHMERSAQEIPAATLVSEVDVTGLMAHISREKHRFFTQHGVKLTLTSYLIEALVATCVEYPFIHATYLEEGIRKNTHVNVGVAVHVPDGLLVPVVHRAETLPFGKKVAALANIKKKVQHKQLSHEDLEGATITITNFGMSGIELGVPIIPHGQTAILGIGSVQKKVVALPSGGIGVQDRVSLTLSFDHRVVDGIYGCDVLSSIKRHIESFSSLG